MSAVLWALDFVQPSQYASIISALFTKTHLNYSYTNVFQGSLLCTLILFNYNAKTIQLFKDNYYGRDILEMLYIWTKVEDFVLLCYNLHYSKF